MCKKERILVFGSVYIKIFEYPHGVLIYEHERGRFRQYFRFWEEVGEWAYPDYAFDYEGRFGL